MYLHGFIPNINIARYSLFALLFFSIGCSEPRPDGMPPLYPVTLEFKQEGTPVSEASIRLIPQSTSQWAVGGSTDSNGKVQLKTHGKYTGAPEGKYKICVNKFVSEGELPQIGKSTPPMVHFNLVETQYTLPNQTPLEIEIVKGKNKFEPFDLGKAVRLEITPPK